jgi:hypothetical protein
VAALPAAESGVCFCILLWLLDLSLPVGCALTFTSEVKFEIEATISFRLKAKKSLISHDSLWCETPKIWSENEGKISKN